MIAEMKIAPAKFMMQINQTIFFLRPRLKATAMPTYRSSIYYKDEWVS